LPQDEKQSAKPEASPNAMSFENGFVKFTRFKEQAAFHDIAD